MDEADQLAGDEAAHLAELAEQAREKASNMPPSFSKIRHLRRAELLEQEAQERLKRGSAV
jgi:hypothetical protein